MDPLITKTITLDASGAETLQDAIQLERSGPVAVTVTQSGAQITSWQVEAGASETYAAADPTVYDSLGDPVNSVTGAKTYYLAQAPNEWLHFELVAAGADATVTFVISY